MITARGGVAALLITGLLLAACQDDSAERERLARIGALHDAEAQAQTAEALNLDPDELMDQVCVIKLQRPERMTQEWLSFCARRGVRGS